MKGGGGPDRGGGRGGRGGFEGGGGGFRGGRGAGGGGRGGGNQGNQEVPGEIKTKLHVRNLGEGVTEAEVKELFNKIGEVVECDIVKDFAFVVRAMCVKLNLGDASFIIIFVKRLGKSHKALICQDNSKYAFILKIQTTSNLFLNVLIFKNKALISLDRSAYDISLLKKYIILLIYRYCHLKQSTVFMHTFVYF